jgi:hypothetical protein
MPFTVKLDGGMSLLNGRNPLSLSHPGTAQ